MVTSVRYEMVTFQYQSDIAYIILHGGKENKLKHADFLPLEKLRNWIEEVNPKGLILCGEKRYFSSGADLEYLRERKLTKAELEESLQRGKEILNYIENLPIVTVAAICGACCGGGLELALSCQFRIAAQNSVFSFPESTLGILPGLGGTCRLTKTVGKKHALKMILSGETYFPEEALEMGLIDSIAGKKEHIEEAERFIQSLVGGKSLEQIHSIISAVNKKSFEYETKQFANLAQKEGFI